MLRRLLIHIESNTLYLFLVALYCLGAALAGCGVWFGLALWWSWPHWAGLIAGAAAVFVIDRIAKAIVDEMVERSGP